MIDRPGAAPREPLFNAPPLVFLLPLLLIGLYGLQTLLGPDGEARLLDGFALNALLLRQGNYDLLLTHLFLHGSWAHVLVNSAFCFAFAAPVVRACGQGFLGVLSFLTFYLLCGIAAGLGYCLLNLHSATPVVGASGAISGLMAASIRLSGDPYDPPGIKPLTHPTVLTMSLFVCGANALIPLAGGIFLTDGMAVAWQAHIAGYIFGLLAISPWLHLFHRRYFTTK
jgi:membrane associated rhomboid family serine protease